MTEKSKAARDERKGICVKRYWKIQNRGPRVAEILIYEEIGESFFSEGIGAKQFAEDLKALGEVDKIVLRINSPGGSVFEGLAIYNQLKGNRAEKEVHVDGIAASIASVIAMAGNTVIMPSNALMMVHDPSGLVVGTSEDMKKMAEALDKVKDSIITAYAAKTGMEKKDIGDLMSAETWMTAEEAVGWGFADREEEAVKMAAVFDLTRYNFKNPQEGIQKMEELKPHQTDAARERERVKSLLAIGREFDCAALAEQYITDGGSEDDLTREILAQVKKKRPSSGPVGGHISVEPAHEGKPFRTFGEFLQQVHHAAMPGARPDHRLFETVTASAGHNEAVPSEGGFAVHPDFTTELLSKTNETAVLAPRCYHIPVSGNGIEAPVVEESSRATGSRWGGVQAYWVTEGGEGTPKKIKLGKLSMKLNKLMAVTYATDELLSDAPALESVITRGFSEEMGFELDAAIVAGPGTGQPLGILNSPCLVSVAKEVGQVNDTIVAENMINMYARMHRAGKQRGVWLVNAECWPQLFGLNLALGATAVPLFMPPGGLTQSPYGTIFGRPVIEVEQAEALGDKGDIIFADFGEYVLIDKAADFSSSLHVRFLTDEQTFKFTLRTNGQPAWKSAKTPYKGTATTSPFITLAAR
jgi:HK97 family phage major capsid protein/ATP-dependent Clp endopeptidase proteolytic subunit ClpP